MPPEDTAVVDGLILDYLLHSCISALLSEWDVRNVQRSEGAGNRWKEGSRLRAEAAKNADRSLLLVNSFLQTYQQLHPSGFRSLDREVRFRLILCRFVALIIRRIDPASSFSRKPQTAVIRCRKQRNSRLRLYLKRRGVSHVFPNDDLLERFLASSTGENELPPEHLVRYCIQRFGSDDDYDDNEGEFGIEQHEGAMGHITRSSTVVPGVICGTASLSDALPLFMLLSAWTSVAVLGSPISTLWMSIAASFMAHAFAEDYLCHGVPPLQAICENFVWGVTPLVDGGEGEESVDFMEEMVINEMFGADEGEVSKEWEKIREEVLEMIVPPKDNPRLEDHLVGTLLAKANIKRNTKIKKENDDGDSCLVGSFDVFEKGLIEGLVMAMVRAVGKPVLAQLEQGELEGVPTGDIEALLVMAGVPRGN